MEIKNIKIGHLVDKQLCVRIGIHSGGCVAGVVGVKMPRYLLFGDTVETAARMESSGQAMKIHVSQATAKILNGSPALEQRGCFYINGNDIVTYWLK